MDRLSRRRFLRYGAGAWISAAACAAQHADKVFAAGHKDPEAGHLPTPTPAQQVWQDCEVGLLYSFDMPIAAGNYAKNNTAREVFDPRLYNPKQLDTDQWIEAAKAAGARYAVFTATHFNGFMQWQSDLYPYGVKQAAWRGGKGDVVGDFVASCRKAGILPGIYFSTHRNVYQTVWGHYVDWGKGKGTEKQMAFNRIAEKMTEELCSRYGQLVQIWFDAGVKLPHEGGPDVLPIFEKHQPNSVFYNSTRRSDHRWIGNENGRAGYPCWATMPGRDAVSHNSRSWRGKLSVGDPHGAVWSPGMADVPLRNHNWFWKPDQEKNIRSVQGLMSMYYNSVGRNCNLLIGEVVATDGRVQDSDIERLAEFGKEVQRRFEKPVAECGGTGRLIELALDRPQRINHMIAMEDIAHGERVRRYVLEGHVPGKTWQPLCDGQSIAHKRIQAFDPVDVARLRLRIDEARAEPVLRRLAVFNVT